MLSSAITQRKTTPVRMALRTVLVTLLAVPASPALLAHDAASQLPPGVSVTGEGKVTAQPDRAALQLGVQARHEDLTEARNDVTRRSNAVLAYLASLGIEERHVNATHINAQPEYRWDPQQETQILTGYSVQRSLELALMNLSLLSAVIEGSADAGANQISPPQLSHSNEAELRRAALRLATEDARANARAIADGLGSTLGEVRDIQASGNPRPVPMARDMMMRASTESAAPAASYVAGDMVFEAQVKATFNLLTFDSKDGV